MNKFILTLFLSVLISTVYAAAKTIPAKPDATVPHFDSREAIAGYALEAMLNRDGKALLHTFAPETVKQGIKIFGSRKTLEAACQTYMNMVPEYHLSRMRKNKPAIIASLAKDRDLVQINGKWYSTHNFNAISLYYTISNVADAIIARDPDALWVWLDEETRTRLTADARGDLQLRNAKIIKLCKELLTDSGVKLVQADKRAYINSLIHKLLRGVNGKRILNDSNGKFLISLVPFISTK